MIFYLFLYFLFGLSASILSVVAWRQKLKGAYIAAWILVGLMTLIAFANFRFIELLFESLNVLLILIFSALIFIPVIFLIKYSTDKPSSSSLDSNFDDNSSGGAVTEDYLDEIINSEDEDIDFEEGLDLR